MRGRLSDPGTTLASGVLQKSMRGASTRASLAWGATINWSGPLSTRRPCTGQGDRNELGEVQGRCPSTPNGEACPCSCDTPSRVCLGAYVFPRVDFNPCLAVRCYRQVQYSPPLMGQVWRGHWAAPLPFPPPVPPLWSSACSALGRSGELGAQRRCSSCRRGSLWSHWTRFGCHCPRLGASWGERSSEGRHGCRVPPESPAGGGGRQPAGPGTL